MVVVELLGKLVGYHPWSGLGHFDEMMVGVEEGFEDHCHFAFAELRDAQQAIDSSWFHYWLWIEMLDPWSEVQVEEIESELQVERDVGLFLMGIG